METLRRLQKNRDALLEQYHSNLEDTYSLQDTLIQEILPTVADELELTSDCQEWAKEWLSDTPSIFRISRRNKFTRSFSLEAIQKILIWRLSNIWPLEPPSLIPNLRCLPTDIRDRFGRAILVIETTPVDESIDSQKRSIIQAFEQLRLHLRKLYDNSEDHRNPPLQYVALLDLKQISLQSMNVELFTWTIREIIPRFPGMLAGVFMLNYSWTHSGFWTIFKRLLPETALSRIFFPSRPELVEYFTPSALPQDYDGNLPSLARLEDPIRPELPQPSEVPELMAPETPPTHPPQPKPLISISWLSPTSILNPFFGYPVSTSSSGRPTFRHGRRRKRDLIRTLATLFWMRWRKHVTFALSLAVLVVILKVGFNKGKLHFPRRLSRLISR
ncbi:CRAL/TRIO domain-containing protein [Pholiota conissans]|uniref:CRAL/TRIO domain-containing protein n=1 Tax=Pholiota conissans TaxID=109636 RepID=A0A9P5Z8M7_9AGAR|nr:CRAL/TRIO domain-containing protein [Pholiota conissans]